ncbi:MAG TPA: APC family permease [Steroidobacteraceae bacterium]|nr:APC family permease [Steroidobacteraceae bacterium]
MSGAPRLRGNIGPLQYLALGFGTMIGSAWVILLGDWLGEAGPGGAVLGFLAGGVVVMIVGACYAELTGYIPEAGSEFVYAHRIYGRGLAFVVGWFLILYLLSVTVFEALACAWVVETLVPTWHSRVLYSAFGTGISRETLLVGIGGALGIIALNYRGARVAVVSHAILTSGFLVIVLCILVALLVNGRSDNWTPLLANVRGRPWWTGSGAIFAFCAYGLNGFQSIPHAVEERSPGVSLHRIGVILVSAIGAAALFYCLVVLAASSIVPWRGLVDAPLPTVAAVAALPYGNVVTVILLIATAASLFKAWNGVFMMATRLVVAMARAGFVPGALARLHPRYESPALAICAVGSCTVAGVFFGKGAIEPITDMSAMVLTLTYVLCCVTVLRLRRSGTRGPYRVPGGEWLIKAGVAGSALMAACAFLAPFGSARGGVPLEWRLLGVWGLLGCAVWFVGLRGLGRLDSRPDPL